jgi:phytoene synthase
VADDAFASFERKWLDANPEQSAVLVFLGPDERRRAAAFGTLIHELTHTTFAVRETPVAAAKLSWWQHELTSAAEGRARHPISIELFGDARAQPIDSMQWVAMIDGAMVQLEHPSAGNFAELLDHYRRFYAPVATVENALNNVSVNPVNAIANLWTCSHVLSALASGSPVAEHFSLPLDAFAKRGISRAAAEQGEHRTEILRDFIADVRTTLDTSLAQAPHAAIGRRVRARADLQIATDAMRSSDPAAALALRARHPRLRHVWWAWREARAARRHT